MSPKAPDVAALIGTLIIGACISARFPIMPRWLSSTGLALGPLILVWFWLRPRPITRSIQTLIILGLLVVLLRQGPDAIWVGTLVLPFDFSDGATYAGLLTHPGYTVEGVEFGNRSSSTVSLLSVKLEFPPPLQIVEGSVVHAASPCTFAPEIESPTVVVETFDKQGHRTMIPPETDKDSYLAVPRYQLFCPDVPPNSHVRLLMATVMPTADPTTIGSMFDTHRHDPASVTVDGSYTADGAEHGLRSVYTFHY